MNYTRFCFFKELNLQTTSCKFGAKQLTHFCRPNATYITIQLRVAQSQQPHYNQLQQFLPHVMMAITCIILVQILNWVQIHPEGMANQTCTREIVTELKQLFTRKLQARRR